MRIVIATPLYPPEIGGPATYAKLLHDSFPGKGIEIDIVKFSTVRHLPKLVRHYAYYRRVLKAAKKADVILALDPVSVGLPAMKAAKKAGKPFVVKIVGDYAWEQGQQRFGITENLDAFVRTKNVPLAVRFLRMIQIRVTQSAMRVLVPSEYLKTIITTWGVDANKIDVIYNAVPVEEAGVVPEKVEILPRPLVVTAGRLVPWKHIEGVIDAVDNTSGVSLAIVGSGSEHDALQIRAKEKLAGRYVFTGQLAHADTLAVVKSADIFVLNSSYEGLSHLLVEAQMLGVPTVATNVGGNPEVITDGHNGLLVPPGDTPALTSAIVRLLADEKLRGQLRATSRESAERFKIETMLKNTADFLTKLV
ncbi:MAG: hypothetical protein JWN18_487 [Parcubacteria group bacterium]|nr:hypothetical protein [Parcubacteria group bacterium]